MKNRNMIFDFTQCYPKRKESGLEWHDCSAIGGSRLYCSRDAEENCPAFTGKVRNLIHSNFYNPARAKGTPESIANEFRRISNQIKMKMYDLYCDEIQNGGYGPTCTCGANRFCRCN